MADTAYNRMMCELLTYKMGFIEKGDVKSVATKIGLADDAFEKMWGELSPLLTKTKNTPEMEAIVSKYIAQ